MVRNDLVASVHEMKEELKSLINRASEVLDNAENANIVDAILVAGQTHRLDFVSVLLAIIAILLALGGLVAFFEVRHRAKVAAEDTARKECRDIAAELLKTYVNDELPDEVRRSVEFMVTRDGDSGDYGEQNTDPVQS